MEILEMTKTHTLHQKIQIVLSTISKGHQLPALLVMTGCLTLQIRLASLNTLMIQEQDNISLRSISGTASTLPRNIQSVRRSPLSKPVELANPSSGSYSSRLSISSSCKSRWPALCPTSRCISPAATISWTWLPIPTSTPLRRSPSTCTTSAYGYCLQILSQEKGQPCNISEIISA